MLVWCCPAFAAGTGTTTGHAVGTVEAGVDGEAPAVEGEAVEGEAAEGEAAAPDAADAPGPLQPPAAPPATVASAAAATALTSSRASPLRLMGSIVSRATRSHGTMSARRRPKAHRHRAPPVLSGPGAGMMQV